MFNTFYTMKAFDNIIYPFAAICCLFLILSSCVESTKISIDEEGAQDEKATDLTPLQRKHRPTSFSLLEMDGTSMSCSLFLWRGGHTPNFSRFPILGLINTTSGSDRITDSGAGATAFSIGQKSYNGAIGVDMQGEAVQTVNELLKHKDGKAESFPLQASPITFFLRPCRQTA